MFDYHIHSNISTDAVDSMQALVDAAYQKGLKEICFTEHYDLDYPLETDEEWCSDIERYNREYASIVIPEGIKVKKGLEVGMTDGIYDRINTVINDNDFDFVIASQHLIGKDDPYLAYFYEGKEKDEVYRAYLLEMKKHIEAFDNFDIVGHIGYITRFAPYENPELEANDYPEELDALLKAVIHKGKGIELNTVGFKKFEQSIPSKSILKRYFDLGGEIITLGSDAHDTKRVGDRNQWALKTLKDIGFKYITTYNKRKKIWHNI